MKNPKSIQYVQTAMLGFALVICAVLTIAQPAPRLVADEYTALISNAISVSKSGHGGARINIPANQSVLIETSELFCLIELRDTDAPMRKHYAFKTFHKSTGYEISGEGELVQNHWSVSKPNEDLWNRRDAQVVDKGSVTVVDAGFLKILWSANRWLYYDPLLASVSAASHDVYVTKIRELKKAAKN